MVNGSCQPRVPGSTFFNLTCFTNVAGALEALESQRTDSTYSMPPGLSSKKGPFLVTLGGLCELATLRLPIGLTSINGRT